VTVQAAMGVISCLLILAGLNWTLQLLGAIQPLRVTVQAACTRTQNSRQVLFSIEWRPASDSRSSSLAYHTH